MDGRKSDRVVAAAAIIVILLGVALSAGGAWMTLGSGPRGEAPELALKDTDRTGLRVAASVPGVEYEEVEAGGKVCRRFSVPGGGETGEIGSPSLPAITSLVAIPPRGGAMVTVVSADSLVIQGVDIIPVEEWALEGEGSRKSEPHFDAAVYGEDAFYPQSVAELGEPSVMRDLRLVQLVIYPLRYNPVRRELHVYQNVEVEITFTGEGQNAKTSTRPRPSGAFEPLYRSLVLNYEELGRGKGGVERGSYLVITHDQFYEEIQPLVEWKRRKGWEVVVTRLSEIDPTPSSGEIKQYISDAYYTWDVPPEYVLLVGDDNMGGIGQFPTFYHQGDCSDLPYTLLEGNDYLPELLIGRISIDSESEADVVVAKTLGYERDPYMGSTAWYLRGLVVATTEDAYSCRTTKRYVAYKLMQMGFAEVDSVWHPPTWSSGPIKTSINNGVSFVNYRGLGSGNGWTYPSFKVNDVLSLTNGWKQPIMTSIICDTGDFGNGTYDPCFGEAWIRGGTTTNPKGGPVMCGPSDLYTHTRWNNALDSGIYWGIADEGLVAFAQALIRGKMELYNQYPLNTYAGGTVEHYFHIYNVLGDPELNMWTAIPEELIADHLASIPLGTNYLAVDLEAGDAPAGGALVCLYKEGEVFAREYTGSDGAATLVFDPGTTGDLLVTATRRNGQPYLGSVSIAQASRFVGSVSYTVDDDNNGGSHGNGDGYVNPSETIELLVGLENWGTQTASSVMGYLTSDDPFVTVTDGEESFGTIAPGATAMCGEDFDFEVSLSCPSDHVIRFLVRATSGGEDYYTVLEVPVRAPDLAYVEHEIVGGNGVLDPGETADLVVTLRNDGLLGVSGVVATLRSTDLWFEIGQSVGSFGTIGAGGTATNVATPFEVSADGALRDGYVGEFVLEVTGNGGYEATVPFELRVGTTGTNDPMGPDEYGYFAYDNTDAGYPERPTYSWVEIDPSYGGSGTSISLYPPDDVDTLSLPFTFRYYGQEFDVISVCTNGFAALGETWVAIPRNYGIPAAFGPDAMLAPFWDELRANGGGVYRYYDAAQHRFIIEWSRYENIFNGYEETFEIVLYDPAYHETATGDGEILFQYKTINNIDSNENYATVGIEEPDQWYGLEYTYANHYAAEAPTLTSGRAIKFTTDSPHLPAVGLELEPDATVYHRGETLGYRAHVTNNTSHAQTIVGRADVTLPNGHPFGGNPAVGPKQVTLPSGQSVHPHLTHHIPPVAPFGSYVYTVTIRNEERGVVEQKEFAFTIVP